MSSTHLKLLTDVLDLVGLLGLVAAAAVMVAMFSVAGAIATAAVGVLAVSWLIDRRRPKPTPGGER